MRYYTMPRLLVVVFMSLPHWAGGAEPRVLVEGCRLELVAQEPAIVTPVAMAFDDAGRLLVIESHTHQRPEEYDGPQGDRVRMLSDSDGDGKLDHWSTFAEGFQQAMGLMTDGPGRVYLVTRRSVLLLVDHDGDGQADSQIPILQLESAAQYPHNALSGITKGLDGSLYLGMGQNEGLRYTITDVDGQQFVDTGGTGMIFRCDADGKNLRRFASGFWNPFSICQLPGGELFAVDNDPHARPPCRLIHVVETGDYGYRLEYDSAGIHPLQSWNGELPGTLPMACGVGESPCAVVLHRGYLWVTSWGDHRLERYQLVPRGASYVAEREIVVQGEADFRPTGCAVAPDGSLYFADWVDHRYPVHGKGRIWRLDTSASAETRLPTGNSATGGKTAIGNSTTGHSTASISDDPYALQADVQRLAEVLRHDEEATLAATRRGELELTTLQAIRWHQYGHGGPVPLLRDALADADAEIRLYAVRWIADERITVLRDEVAQLLAGEIPSQRYYLAVLAAIDWLDNSLSEPLDGALTGKPKKRDAQFADALLARELDNPDRSPQLHALALRLISADHPWVTLGRLQAFLQSDHAILRREAVRTLVVRSDPDRFELLAEITKNNQFDDDLRADAVAGLAGSPQHVRLLEQLAASDAKNVAREALRGLRFSGAHSARQEDKPAPSDLEAWNRLLATPGDPESGRRLFFSNVGARCSVCHQHRGRGGRIGPDLTRIAASNTRGRIIESILQPSREMAPDYQPWVLQTDDGRTVVALRLHKGGDSGKEIYVDANGVVLNILGDEIEFRQASTISIMPSGLEQTVSIDDLRDLITFLTSQTNVDVE